MRRKNYQHQFDASQSSGSSGDPDTIWISTRPVSVADTGFDHYFRN